MLLYANAYIYSMIIINVLYQLLLHFYINAYIYYVIIINVLLIHFILFRSCNDSGSAA